MDKKFNLQKKEEQATFHTVLKIPACWSIDVQCPHGISATKCDMHQYLTNHEIFILDSYGNIDAQRVDTLTQLCNEIKKMSAICEKCKKQHSSGR